MTTPPHPSLGRRLRRSQPIVALMAVLVAAAPATAVELSEFDLARIDQWRVTAESKGLDGLRDRTRGHLRGRRKSVPEYRDHPREPIPILADLRSDPGAYEDVPVILWGRVTAVETIETGGSEPERFVVANVDFHDQSDRPVQVIATASDSVIEGAQFVGIGFFLNFDAEERPTFFAVQFDVLGDRIAPNVLAVVEHESLQRAEERDAYFTGLVQARMADMPALRRRANEFRDERATKFRFRKPEDFPTFVDLFKHPDVYLGRPVTLSGHSWSITKLPALDPAEGDEAEYGVDTLYQIQLYTPDSQTNAASIVCTELPEGLPSSGHFDERIDGLSVTGFFYKMGKYYDQRNQGRKIPIVLARTVTWDPPEEFDRTIPAWVYWVAAGGITVLVAVVGWVTTRDRAARQAARERLETIDAPTFEGLGDDAPPEFEETES